MIFLLETKSYRRDRAVSYARKWAYARNPLFADFSDLGGDCTNFVSQCLFAGCCTMNFTDTFGWYYVSPDNRAAAWTGVEYLFRFLLSNRETGPFAEESELSSLSPGDVVQIGKGGALTHSLLVERREGRELYLAAHTLDVRERPLSSYQFDSVRFLRILGFRTDETEKTDCFPPLYAGSSLIL